MKFGFKIIGDIAGDLKKFDRRLARASTKAMAEGSTGLKTEYRTQILAAGMGQRLANTWRSAVYPEGGRTSKNAAGLVWSNAPHIVDAFVKGGVIHVRNKKFLAIPTKFAMDYVGGGKNRKQMTPQNFTKETGIELFLVQRKGQGKNPLLVARGVRVRNRGSIVRARVRKATLKKDGSFGRGERVNLAQLAEVPMFTLVPYVRERKTLDVEGPARRWGAQGGALIDKWMGDGNNN